MVGIKATHHKSSLAHEVLLHIGGYKVTYLGVKQQLGVKESNIPNAAAHLQMRRCSMMVVMK